MLAGGRRSHRVAATFAVENVRGGSETIAATVPRSSIWLRIRRSLSSDVTVACSGISKQAAPSGASEEIAIWGQA